MDLVDVFAVFALFVVMLSLLCFYALPFSSVNKDLYNDHVTSYVLNVTLFQVEMVIFFGNRVINAWSSLSDNSERSNRERKCAENDNK